MANKDQPMGFSPFGDVKRLSPYVAGGTIYPGDTVLLNSAGAAVVGTATAALIGVAANYVTSGQTVMVWDDPDQLFICQASDTEVAAQTNLNLNYNLLATAGDSTYKNSRQELDSSTGATTAALPLKLLRILPAIDNAYGANAKCVVQINNHILGHATGTVGI